MSRARDTADQINRVNSSAADATAITVDSSENVGIGTSSPDTPLEIQIGSSGNAVKLSSSADGISVYLAFEQQESGTKYVRGRIRAASNGADGGLIFESGSSGSMAERMRLDALGNLLVGKTASSYNTVGCELLGNGAYEGLGQFTTDGIHALTLNRKTSNGDIVQFRKDGTTVGNITTNSAGNIHINSQNGTFALRTINVERYAFDQEQIYPWNNGECNLGLSYRRFDVVYAATGSINTSDQTQKQDIESLTATEMLVGKRLSALFKTFRWKNRVAEKGDSARTHTGIMAQDVQTAFTAEGLDASNYALFCSDTWWEHDVEVPAVEAVAEETDEDGNVTTEAVEAVDAYTRTDEYKTEDEAPEGAISKTLLGIRYPELLSFVAAYNEQRFASIEARLTALEA